MMIRYVAAVVGFLVFGLFASASTAEANGRLGHGGARFFGLWEGIDAIDGSGMQRSIMEGADGTLKIVGRETFFWLLQHWERDNPRHRNYRWRQSPGRSGLGVFRW
jgi:hypothetical protein